MLAVTEGLFYDINVQGVCSQSEVQVIYRVYRSLKIKRRYIFHSAVVSSNFIPSNGIILLLEIITVEIF